MYLSTDSLGYIAHRNAYEWGGYEVRTSPCGPDAGTKLTAEILSAAQELKTKLEAGGLKLDLPGQRDDRAPANRPGG